MPSERMCIGPSRTCYSEMLESVRRAILHRSLIITTHRRIGRRCRPCGACDASRAQFFDECYIVKNEMCMLYRACKNGREVWNTTGSWRCEPDYEQLRLASRGVRGSGRRV